jgi:hypothetical protein
MSNKSNANVATMGIDIGKNSFHVVGLDRRGATAEVSPPSSSVGCSACIGRRARSERRRPRGAATEHRYRPRRALVAALRCRPGCGDRPFCSAGYRFIRPVNAAASCAASWPPPSSP